MTGPRKLRITPVVLRDASKWRAANHKILSLDIKIERAPANNAGIRILPRSHDDHRKIVRLFREENVSHHTSPLASERNIHAVIRGIPAAPAEAKIKEELQRRRYAPLQNI
nr:unnamed protein product [Callosobruchus chinensis]